MSASSFIHPVVAKKIEQVAYTRAPVDITVAYQTLERQHEFATNAIGHLRYKLDRVEAELREEWRPGTERENGTTRPERGDTLARVQSSDLLDLERCIVEINAARRLILALEAREAEKGACLVSAALRGGPCGGTG